nr:MAG TPA: hypothetical protein [Caudoviricetes sp.]
MESSKTRSKNYFRKKLRGSLLSPFSFACIV